MKIFILIISIWYQYTKIIFFNKYMEILSRLTTDRKTLRSVCTTNQF